MSATHVDRRLLAAAAVCGFTGVLAGTFGAHGLEGRLAADMLDTFEVGVRYHLTHAVALLGVAMLAGFWPHAKSVRAAGWLMVLGIMVFAGTLYALAISGQKWLGMITPIGGAAFLIAWLLLAVAAIRSPRLPGAG